MQCKEVQNLVSEYSIGLIRGRKRSDMDRHLAECPECAGEFDRLQKALTALDELDPLEPPAGLWNGVRNQITPAPQREGMRARLRRRVAGLSVGLATVALAAVLLFTQVRQPAQEFHAYEYVQGHAVYSTRDPLANQAALNTIAAVAYREQVGGDRQ